MRNILGKQEVSLKRDLAFTDRIFGNLDMKKKKLKDIYGQVPSEYLKLFVSSK